MKKYVRLVLASMFILSMSAMAQQQVPPPGQNGMRQQIPAKVRAENMAKDLALTDAEKANVQEVYEKNDVIFTKFRSEVKRDDPDFKEKVKALKDAQDSAFINAIGKEKYQTWQKIQAERRQNMSNK